MARYGDFLYGSGVKYGLTANANLLWSVEVDWNGDGLFDGSNEAHRVQSISFTRGRDKLFTSGQNGESGFARFQVGQAQIVLENSDRRYDPYYATSPLYPNVLPGREVRIKVRNGATGSVYSVFRGKIDSINRSGYHSDPTVTMTVVDGWQLLSDRRATVALRTNATTDQVIGDVLDDAGWLATWGRSLDVGSDVIPYAWVNDQSCFDAIHDLAESELGLAYVAWDGKFTFLSRHTLTLTNSVFTLDQANVLNEPVVDNPWDVVKNKVSVKAFPRSLQSSGEIWRLTDVPLLVPGQAMTVWGTYRDSAYNETIAQNVIDPAATTDYTMNTQADGLGTNLTASFTVVASKFAGSVKLVVTNGGTVAGYITLLKIRGQALALQNVSASVSESSASQAAYGVRQLTIELPYQQQAAVAVDLSDWLISWLATPLPSIQVEIENAPTLQFAYDIGTYLTFTSAFLGLNLRMRICKIRHEGKEKLQGIKTTWTLEPVGDFVAYWQLGVAGADELGQNTRLAY